MSSLSVALDCEGNGTWLTLPADAGELNKALLKIGVLDKPYSIGDYRTPVGDEWIGPFIVGGDINEVNYLAARLAELPQIQLDTLDAVMRSPMRFDNISQLIDFTYNTDYFILTADVKNAHDLGRYCLYTSGEIQMREEWKSAIDTEALGKRIAEVENGAFTARGYLNLSGDEWKPVYEKNGVIPPEYRFDNDPKNAEQTAGQDHKTAAEKPRKQEKPSILRQLKEPATDATRPGPAKEKKPPGVELD